MEKCPKNLESSGWSELRWFQNTLYYFCYWSILDESCIKESGKFRKHMCWDAHYLYNYIDTPLFVSENIYEAKNYGEVMLKTQKEAIKIPQWTYQIEKEIRK